MRIAFTGHRNKIAAITELEQIAARFSDAEWVHGGAIGFDTQVQTIARDLKIPTIIIRPDYAKFSKVAPLVRNRDIVDSADILVALYDGRNSGGTKYTIDYAIKKGKQVIFLACA